VARKEHVSPQPSPILSRWLSRYLGGYFSKHFDAVRISKSGRAPELDSIHGHIETALETNMDQLGREALSRDPRRFDTLILGRFGVGGLHDQWRRWRAARQGRSLVLSHEDRRR